MLTRHVKSVNQYGLQRASMLKTIEMRNCKLAKAEEYELRRKANSPFKAKHFDDGRFSKEDRKPKGVRFEHQRGHESLEQRGQASEPSRSDTRLTHTGGRFFESSVPTERPLPALVDWRKTVRAVDMRAGLPRAPFTPQESARGGKSYAINWAAVQRRSDAHCPLFAKQGARPALVTPAAPSSTDGYFGLLDRLAASQTRQAGQASKKTAADSRTTGVVDFKKVLPRSRSQASGLPSFMQRGAACSRFAVQFMNTAEDWAAQMKYRLPAQKTRDLDAADNSFDNFFGHP